MVTVSVQNFDLSKVLLQGGAMPVLHSRKNFVINV